MRINPKTHMFEELTLDQADELSSLAEKLINGEYGYKDSPILEEWFSVTNPRGNSSITRELCGKYLPMKMLLSANKRFTEIINDKNCRDRS